MPRDLLKTRNLRIISLVNQKGGVGKTASAVSLSTGLAIAGQRVLVIDADPQGNLTLFFTEEKTPDLSDLLRELASDRPAAGPEKYMVKNVRENLDLMPLFNRKLRSDVSEVQLEGIFLRFIEWIQALKKEYDWIIFDCSPSNGKLEKLMISSSEAVLVPLELQLFSIAGLSSLLEEIKDCGKATGRSIMVEALIFTKTESRLNRVREYREIFQQFYIPIYEVCKSEVLPRSIEMKKTVWEHAPTSSVCKDYYQIIEKSFIG